MDRANIHKIASSDQDKILLAKLYDKIHSGILRNIPASTCFLSLREQEMARYLFGNTEGLLSFGGHPEAERQMLLYLPDYLDDNFLYSEDSPICCLRAHFYEGDSLSHRDFLGGLMSLGIGRETVGDICINTGSCDLFVASEVAPFLLQEFTSAGRTKLRVTQIPLQDAFAAEPETLVIKDTLASLRLDNVIAAGFRIGRSTASQYIASGKASINGLPCEKPDKIVEKGARVSVRGLGKIRLTSIGGQTKKGRISVVIERYV